MAIHYRCPEQPLISSLYCPNHVATRLGPLSSRLRPLCDAQGEAPLGAFLSLVRPHEYPKPPSPLILRPCICSPPPTTRSTLLFAPFFLVSPYAALPRVPHPLLGPCRPSALVTRVSPEFPGAPRPPRSPGGCARRGDGRHTLTRRPASARRGLAPRGMAGADWLGPRGRRSRFTVGSTAAWMLLGPAAAPEERGAGAAGWAGGGASRSRSRRPPGPRPGQPGSRGRAWWLRAADKGPCGAAGAERGRAGWGMRGGAGRAPGPQRRP